MTLWEAVTRLLAADSLVSARDSKSCGPKLGDNVVYPITFDVQVLAVEG